MYATVNKKKLNEFGQSIPDLVNQIKYGTLQNI